MKIEKMFSQDINRHIDKVVKVDQTSEDRLYQEIVEYVLTKEIRRNFNDFFNSYEKSIDFPNDNIGVWISGFFGSGKSHFLKMLSYLLTNKSVKGKETIEYFRDKFNDPMMFSTIERCVQKQADAIMFDVSYVGQAAGKKLDLVTIFAKEFYDHLGFYGTDLKVAKFEKFLTDQGKYDLFKQNFKQINGDDWFACRDTFSFWEDDIVEAYKNTLGCSETQARNWFNGVESYDLNVKKLADELKKYVDSKGPDFRLLFMIDEMGMYIGDSTDLMLSLQALIQEIGVVCNGKVWVMCTGQEAIDSIIKVKGADLSKILARFDIKLKLSSSSTDEVIKKRLLAKEQAAEETLKLQYAQNAAVLKNLFTFNHSVLDLKGYSDEENFVETYPFVSYQFILEQKVLSKIRLSGFAGTSLSTGERTMLAAFQLAAQDISSRDENALVPFYYFYSIVEKDLDHQIRIVFERCAKAAENHDGLEPYDLKVLKLLFLIRKIDDFAHNIDNICILMVDDIRADKIKLRVEIAKSLERLLNQNYIARNGDSYDFLTDDEQDIAREIRGTTIDSAQIINSIGEIIFGDLYLTKKYHYDKYDFAFDKIIDDTIINTPTGGIKLRIVTQASDLYNRGESTWIMKSALNNEAYVVLSSEYPYFDELENSAKIKKYIKTRNVSQLPEAIQNIIRMKQQQANSFEKNAKGLIEKSIIGATFIVNGQKIEAKGSSIKDKLDYVLSYLVESVYTKLSLIKVNYNSDEEILEILSHNQGLNLEATSANEDAIAEIEQYLTLQQTKFLPTSMADVLKRFLAIPYGWREIDIAACVAELIKKQTISLQYSGNVISALDKHIVDYLRKKTEVDKVLVIKRVSISAELVKKVRNFLKDYLEEMDVPTKEDDLVAFAIEVFETKLNKCNDVLSYYARGKYPQKDVIENSISLFNDILSRKKDNESFLNVIDSKKDELFDLKEDADDVLAFFNNQVNIFDKALSETNKLRDEKEYLKDVDAISAFNAIVEIVEMERPYKRIIEIPNYLSIVNSSFEKLLDSKKDEVVSKINGIRKSFENHANENNKAVLDRLMKEADDKEHNLNYASKLTVLDAAIINLDSFEKNGISELINEGQTVETKKKVKVVNKSNVLSSKAVTKENLDEYIAELKKKLSEMLDENDEIDLI